MKKYRGPVLDIDDLWMTGIIADYGRIKRYNNARFRYYCGLDICHMDTSLVMHACADSRQTKEMYSIWKGSDTTFCYNNPFLFDNNNFDDIFSSNTNKNTSTNNNNPQLTTFNFGNLRFVIQSK